MEAKELKIQAPEGYEIDKENSTFECIKFKPIKKGITYKNVSNKLFNDNECLEFSRSLKYFRCISQFNANSSCDKFLLPRSARITEAKASFT